MGRRPLIACGAGAVAIVVALVAFLVTRGDGDQATTPVADVVSPVATTPSPSTTAATTPPAATTSAPTTVKPSAAPTTSTVPPTSTVPTKSSTGKVFARPPATVEARANNTYTFYVEQIAPLDSVVDVHLLANGSGLTLHCPTPVSPGNCQVAWTTGSHDLVVRYYVTIKPVDPRYRVYNSTPLQFTTG